MSQRNLLSRIPRLWRLTISLCAILTLITGGVVTVNIRATSATNGTNCLQFVTVDWNRFGEPVYPMLLDADWDTSLPFRNRPVPVAVHDVAEHAPYRVIQTSHVRRSFSFPTLASVENTATGTRVDLPSVISNNSILWSHDGMHFAYYNIAGDKNNIYSLVLADADGSHSKTLPMPPFNQIASFQWSPDDQYLIMSDYFYTSLIRVADGQMQALATHKGYESVSTFTWSPRGHQLAYLWAETGIPNHVVIYDPDTGSQHMYVRPDEKYWWDGRLLWSPDMRYIAVVGWVDGQIDIVRRDGSGVSLGMVGWDNQSLATLWLPDSDRILFMTTNNDLIAYNATTGAYQPLVSKLFDSHIELLADQHSLIFARQADDSFALMKMDTRDNSVTSLLVGPSAGWITRFHVLSDRTKLLVFLYENSLFRVVLFDTATNTSLQLASGLNDAFLQRIWDDPATFMFFWGKGGNSFQPMQAGWAMYDLAGNQLAQFQGDDTAFATVNDLYYFVPFWSPDHRYAVFTYNDPELYKGVLVMSSDGKQAWHLGQNVWGIDLDHILWSPDSSKVAFIVNIAGKATILVYTADGTLLAKTDKSLLSEYVRWTSCQL